MPTVAFIVRPFGVKGGIAFDDVEATLIAPALDALGIQGRTTAEIARAGNIRTDMFERLLLADVVIADISIHNANVFYELGIRHALRPRTTILIRAACDDEPPFDLKTDRYLAYDGSDPAAALDQLVATISQSLVADNADSPVFLPLPTLQAADPDALRPVPAGFAEAVARARRSQDLPMLAVLGEEAAGFAWRTAGMRLVAQAQFDLGDFHDARIAWESIRRRRPDDPQANLALGTVFQRLGDPAASTAAIERVLANGDVAEEDLAEALALLARNAKERWLQDWRSQPEPARAALCSPFLDAARKAYDEAFYADQNHWYSGVNALALIVVTLGLAQAEPDAWADAFDSEDEAQQEIARLEHERDELAAAVDRSLDAQNFRDERLGTYDVWADLSRADLRLLRSPAKPRVVARAYEKARARLERSGKAIFSAESAAKQLRIYLELGLFTENARAALAALGAAEQPPEPPPRPHVLVFAGHRIDAPGRAEPRFPAAAEAQAGAMIRAAIVAQQALAEGQPIEGIAGGANGADILFHEICAELGIPTTLLLAVPREQFAAASVVDAGPDWVQRFQTLCERLEIKVLADSAQLPEWLAARESYSIWERNNRWILHSALSRGDTDITLVVLWDGKGEDGPGGTQDMVQLAESRGVGVVRLDAAQLL